MKCAECQSENRDGAKFCLKCGESLESVCSGCGKTLPFGANFCDECGCDLSKPKSAPPVDYSRPQSYTPKFLADKILKGRSSLEGERKLVTVLFADVANYTAMSEKLDTEEVHQIMDGCFRILMDEIHRYEGSVNQFTGDGVMALFGAPVAHEDHAQRACHAALAIQRAIGEYGDKVRRDCGVDFKMRIGLNSGPVVVGAIGNDLRMDYTAQGDTTNLASRMQGLAEPESILVGPDTYRMARRFFQLQPLGKRKLKGKAGSVEAYRLLKASGAETRIEASAMRGLTPFVGHESEMEALKGAFERARSGSGRVMGIVGEAGVGKSRLIVELKRTIPRQEYTHLEGHCLHYGSAMPYLPLLDVLRSYFDIKEGEREFLVKKRMAEKIEQLDERLRAILPPLHELLSLKVEDEAYLKLEPQKKRERTFEAIRDLLVVESQRKPLMVAIDDFQWTDRTSEEFLTYLIGHLPSSSILLLLLYRPEYTHDWESRSCYSQIRVDELPTRSGAELVRAMLEEGEVAPELRELILNRTAGNPLFMEEFTHTLLENGSIQKKDHRYVLSRKPSEIHVPDTVQGIIAARIDRLDDNLKRIMHVASVIGRDFAYRILQAITGMQEELKSHLLTLQGLEFIYEKSLYPELEYVFRHALTQEVAYNSLLVKRRKEIHGKIAKAIEELYPGRLAEFCGALAHHYSMAENWNKAFQYLSLSAEKAHHRYSTREAFDYYRQALDILGRLPDTEQNKRATVDVMRSGYPVITALNFPEGSLDMLAETLRASEELGDRLASVGAYAGIGLAHLWAGRTLEAVSFTQTAFDEAEKLGDESTVVRTAATLCNVYLYCGDPIQLADLAARCTALCEEANIASRGAVPEFDQYVTLLYDLGWAKAMLGDFDEGERLCQKAISLSADIRSQYSSGGAHTLSAMIAAYRGTPESLLQHAQEAVRISEEAQISIFLGTSWLLKGYGHYYRGDYAAAQECVERSFALALDHGLPGDLSAACVLSGLVSQAVGNLPEARQTLEQAVKGAQDNLQKHYEAQARVLLGRLIIDEDASQIAVAKERILEGLRIAEDLQIKPLQAYGHLWLGEAYAIAGQKKKALASLNRAHRMCQKMGMDYYLARAEKALAKLKG